MPLILMFASRANAFLNDNLSPSSFGAIKVEIIDSATDGCWTNLGQAKAYAKYKQEILGYKAVSDWPYSLSFRIYVLNARSDSRQ